FLQLPYQPYDALLRIRLHAFSVRLVGWYDLCPQKFSRTIHVHLHDRRQTIDTRDVDAPIGAKVSQAVSNESSVIHVDGARNVRTVSEYDVGPCVNPSARQSIYIAPVFTVKYLPFPGDVLILRALCATMKRHDNNVSHGIQMCYDRLCVLNVVKTHAAAVRSKGGKAVGDAIAGVQYIGTGQLPGVSDTR